ncbi:hypothetical protein FM101_04040 [Arthrobacter rhombi]|uniref:Uncharacterized protein n=1 Tax=Arthrobacter rhombi TaxID=71253 RepID=A0A1R4FHZ7_9MICC|nr:hypothetical protein FM101_04040 [Arthrobacter rhombi]
MDCGGIGGVEVLQGRHGLPFGSSLPLAATGGRFVIRTTRRTIRSRHSCRSQWGWCMASRSCPSAVPRGSGRRGHIS